MGSAEQLPLDPPLKAPEDTFDELVEAGTNALYS
jgi:hypothetical protein